ncbi:MAG: NAD(P)-dependent oxidoreductase, partial [Anaerococcus obesiensis]
MRYFPISIDSKDKICLFLGGGKICKRKIESLLRGDFSFLIYGKEIDKEVIKLYKENPQRIKIVEKNIDENLLAGKKVLSVVFGEHKLKLVIVAFLVIYSTLTNVGLSL